jgi:hypothetical protein
MRGPRSNYSPSFKHRKIIGLVAKLTHTGKIVSNETKLKKSKPIYMYNADTKNLIDSFKGVVEQKIH